jgi:flavin-dependent dehydrogenase
VWTTIENAANGWYYTVGIPDGRRIVVFLTDSDLPECKMASSPPQWCQMLDETDLIRAILDRYKYVPVGRVRGIPASSVRLDRPFGFHWVAAGDAAAAFDPLTSRGIAAAVVTGSNASSAVLEEHAGRRGAFAAYAEDIAKNYAEYLSELRQRYRGRQSGRSEFWTRRSRLPVSN